MADRNQVAALHENEQNVFHPVPEPLTLLFALIGFMKTLGGDTTSLMDRCLLLPNSITRDEFEAFMGIFNSTVQLTVITATNRSGNRSKQVRHVIWAQEEFCRRIGTRAQNITAERNHFIDIDLLQCAMPLLGKLF